MSQLGSYLEFPAFAHYDLSYKAPFSSERITNLIARGLSMLNSLKERISTSVAGHSGTLPVQRVFEVGIAEGLCFNYFDEDEVRRLSELSQPPKQIDFILYANYRYSKNGKTVRLLPDRYLVRFCLDLSLIRVFHMGGLRRTTPEDVGSLVLTQINLAAKASGIDEEVSMADEGRS